MKVTINFGGFGLDSLYNFDFEMNEKDELLIGELIVGNFNYQFKTKLDFVDLLSNQKVIFSEDKLIVNINSEDIQKLENILRDNKELVCAYNEKLDLIEREIDQYDKVNALVNTLYQWVQYDIHQDIIETL